MRSPSQNLKTPKHCSTPCQKFLAENPAGARSTAGQDGTAPHQPASPPPPSRRPRLAGLSIADLQALGWEVITPRSAARRPMGRAASAILACVLLAVAVALWVWAWSQL